MAKKQTNEDLKKKFLRYESTGPVISSIRPLLVTQKHLLPTGVLNLFEEPNIISDEDKE